MGETNIEWAHYTVNAWMGCSKISPACKHCYAEHDTPVRVVEQAMGLQELVDIVGGRARLPMWGHHNPSTGAGYRVETVGWEKQLRALNRKAARDGKHSWMHERPRVFFNSLSDTFEAFEGPIYRKKEGRFEVVANSLDDVRKRLFAVIEECTELDILLLTKRPENVLAMVPAPWLGAMRDADMVEWGEWPSHVWLGTTVENQDMADKRIPEILRIPARVRFLSMEPLLGEVDLAPFMRCKECGYTKQDALIHFDHGLCKGTIPDGINWVIVGGESGKNARPMHPDWARKIRDQCAAAGVSFFFKQWGNNAPDDAGKMWRYSSKHHAGRQLDGREWNEVPK